MRTLVIASVAAGAISWLLAWAARTMANRHGVMDIPNERSSHKSPIPRGGGVAIVVVVIGTEFILFAADVLPLRVAVAFILPGAAISVVGMWDDVQTLGALPRLFIHIVAALFAVWSLAPAIIDRGTVGSCGIYALQVIGIIWLTNIYNFMDGIDGIAAVQGIIAAIADAILLSTVSAPSLSIIAVTVAGSAAGFLILNWAPATIFMGDVGSSFLGFTFAALSIAGPSVTPTLSHTIAPVLLTILLLLPLAPFILDATLTLMVRALRRERIIAAHREHAYQRAVRGGLPHQAVAAVVGILSTGASIAAITAFYFQSIAYVLVAAALLASLVAYLAAPRLRT